MPHSVGSYPLPRSLFFLAHHALSADHPWRMYGGQNTTDVRDQLEVILFCGRVFVSAGFLSKRDYRLEQIPI